MGLNLCELLESIIPGQVMGSQHFNGIWSIWIKTKEARQHLAELGSIEINNIRIELFTTCPKMTPVPNEKIVLKDIPVWVPDSDVIQFLNNQQGIIVKSGVITARFRDQNNKLTPYFTGDRFVFVKGKMTKALHHSALINYAKCRIWHKSQELACRRCRHIGHLSTNLKACDAYIEDQDIITIRSPNCVMSNYFLTHVKVFDQEFRSSEHAYQWRFLKYIGMDDLAESVLSARTPADAKAIASRVPMEFHKDWHTIKVWVMKDILHAKADYCTPFKNALIQSGETPLVECTSDLFWASGLSPHDTSMTDPSFYPGRNNLGRVLSQVRSDLIKEAVLLNQIDVESPDNICPNQPPLHQEVKPASPDPPVVPCSTSTADVITTSASYVTSTATSDFASTLQISDQRMTFSSSPDSSTPSAQNSNTTSSQVSVNNLSDSSEDDISNTTLSGIEELSLTPNDSSCTSSVQQGDSPADKLDHCSETHEFSDSNANIDEMVYAKKKINNKSK